MRFRLPAQAADAFKASGDSVIYSTPAAPVGIAGVARLDLGSLELDLSWNDRAQELAAVPAVVILSDWVQAKPKPEALSELAGRVLDPASGTPNEVSLALLRRDPPAFTPGNGPPAGQFSDDPDEMTSWVHHLNHSYLAIQGPPGTGKTFRGARLIRSLILSGKRVGITAMSHYAIDNLLEAVIDAFELEGGSPQLRAVKRGSRTYVRWSSQA